MNKTLLGLILVISACADSGDSGGFGGTDSLPKRGGTSTDPTIVSARVRCDSSYSQPRLYLYVIASDPSGELGSCHADLDGVVGQNTFDGDNDCNLSLSVPCATMPDVTLELLVANDRAGLTEATVTLLVEH